MDDVAKFKDIVEVGECSFKFFWLVCVDDQVSDGFNDSIVLDDLSNKFPFCMYSCASEDVASFCSELPAAFF